MVRNSDLLKGELWSDRIRRFHEAKQTVLKFCESEGVSKASFYHWKKRLAANSSQPATRPVTQAAKTTAKSVEQKFQPVQIAVASPLATIRLPEGVVVELNNTAPAVEMLKQLLARGEQSC